MDSIKILKNNYNIENLINDYLIAKNDHPFINPNKINEKSFSISDKTYGWEAIPLNTLNGIQGNQGTIPVNIIENNNFLPTNTLLKCKYFQKILSELNTEIYLVRIMKLKAGGYIAPHIDKLINFKDGIIRCQIPIITNDNVYFNIDNKNYNLKAGNLYYINVGEKEHSVKNNSKYDRITLVIDLKINDSIKKILLNI